MKVLLIEVRPASGSRWSEHKQLIREWVLDFLRRVLDVVEVRHGIGDKLVESGEAEIKIDGAPAIIKFKMAEVKSAD